MKVTFIRHGKTLVEPEKPIVLWGLSDAGIEGMKELSNHSVIRDLDVIYSSLQTKAIETSLYLAKPNAIPMNTHSGLAEVSSFTDGPFTTGKEYEDSIKDYYDGKIERIADGETIEEAITRFTSVVDEIVKFEEAAGKTNVGIVTHGYILSFITAPFCNKTPYELHHIIAKPDIAIVDWQIKQFLMPWGEVSI